MTAGKAMIAVESVTPVVTPTVTAVTRSVTDGACVTVLPTAKPDRAVVLTAVLLATSFGLGATGLVVNARFAASFGQTRDAALLLAAIGVALDVLAIVLPVTAGELWRQRRFVAAGGAWSIWVMALAMTLTAASGFASMQIGDAVAGRSKTVDQAAGLTERLHRLRAERAQVREQRAVATIDGEMQVAQAAAGAGGR